MTLTKNHVSRKKKRHIKHKTRKHKKRKHNTRKHKKRKHKTRKTRSHSKYCRCKKRCRCKNICKCKRKYTKHHRRKHRRKHHKGGARMLNPSDYPNPIPKGGPWDPNSISNGLGKGYFYKNNTNPYLPNPQNTQVGGGSYSLAENIPGGIDVLDTYWGGVNGAKNLYQSWIGGTPYPSPNPIVQPIDKPSITLQPSHDISSITKQSQTNASGYK